MAIAKTYVDQVSLTTTNIKALRATPFSLVVAPGAGKALEFVSAQLYYDYATAGLTESEDNFAVKYTDGSGVAVSQAIETTGFIDAAADYATNALPKIDAIVAKAGAENQALVLHNTGDGEISGTGGGVLRVRTTYRVHVTGF